MLHAIVAGWMLFTLVAQLPRPMEPTEAVTGLHQAAEQGHAGAQFGLAMAYRNGEGVTKNTRQAEHWLQKSAAQGYAPATFYLGKMHFNGEFGSPDYDQACQWTLIAGVLAKRGCWDRSRPNDAADVRRELPDQISRIREKLTTAQLTDCVLKAEEWLAANPALGPK
jgi:TPR repeat protein